MDCPIDGHLIRVIVMVIHSPIVQLHWHLGSSSLYLHASGFINNNVSCMSHFHFGKRWFVLWNQRHSDTKRSTEAVHRGAICEVIAIKYNQVRLIFSWIALCMEGVKSGSKLPVRRRGNTAHLLFRSTASVTLHSHTLDPVGNSLVLLVSG